MSKRRAFTLVEIMIVTVIVGVLAALALPSFNRVRVRAITQRYLNDVRVVRDAAERHAMETGAFPPNGIGGLHTALQGYVPAKMFTEVTPLGGAWDWDYQQNGFTAAVSVYQFTASDAQLLDIDRAIDDGVLTTGLFQKASGKAIYVIVP
jgi:prepilin-type N-terminal cleavage/methylation domain-containing protein